MNQMPHEPPPLEPVHEHVLLALRLRNAAIEADKQHRPVLADLLTKAASVIHESIPQLASPTSPT